MAMVLRRKKKNKVYWKASEQRWVVEYKNRDFAKWYKGLTLSDIREVIRGYEKYYLRGAASTDGTVSGNRVVITNTGKRWLEFLEEIAKSIGIRTRG